MTLKKSMNLMTICLLVGMALHYQLITILLDDNIILRFWKEIIITIIILYTSAVNFLMRRRFGDNLSIDRTSLLFSFFLFFLFFSGIVLTEDFYTFIFVSRRYLVPLLLYYFAKNSRIFSYENLDKIFKSIIVSYFILCIWGIFQALVLGDTFLIDLGYPLKYEGRLFDSFYFYGFGDLQRVVATLANTNVFGSLLGMIIIFTLLNNKFMADLKFKRFYLIIISVSLFLTFSRSNWLAIGLVLILTLKNKRIQRDIGIMFFLTPIIMLLVGAITNNNYFEIVFEYIENTITLEDTSAAGRGEIWEEGFQTFLSNPLGIGMGYVGRVAEAVGSEEEMIGGESSYIALLLDTGIQGFVFYIGGLLSMLKRTSQIKNETRKNIIKTSNFLIVYLLVMFTFSNHIYDLEMMIFAFFIIGVSKNKFLHKDIEELSNSQYVLEFEELGVSI